ncbi:hypothetical protein EHR07_02020 [Leptospira bandrabouensis]|nr:hypothetical protein EHR07_02020 [Leptospira bandrabouensis]
MTPERWKSDDRKSYETAQSDWIQANLRKESGSAISDEEFSKNAKTYFPQAGDSPEILKQKAQLRGIMENNMKSEARPAYEYDIQFSAPRQSSNSGESVMRHPKTGKMYRVKDGKIIGEL